MLLRARNLIAATSRTALAWKILSVAEKIVPNTNEFYVSSSRFSRMIVTEPHSGACSGFERGETKAGFKVQLPDSQNF